MNLRILNQSLTRNLDDLRPRVESVFRPIISSVARRPHAVNVATFLASMKAALAGTKVRVVKEVTTKFGAPKDTDGQYYPALGGFCFEPNPGRTARIEIIVCIHPHTNRLPLSVESWEYFQYRFLKCLTHELVHRAQFENGRKQDNALIFRPHASANVDKGMQAEQRYLGDMDEVEAYAHDCVEEWYYIYPQTPLHLRGIKREFRNKGGRLPAIQYYYGTFLGDESHPSVQRFFRKIKAWDEIIRPLSFELPDPPAYVQRHAKVQRDIRLG
jgi:hypothetical protein